MDKFANKSDPKATSSEEKAKQHLISVGLYGRSVSIILNSFRLTSIISSYADKHVFKEFNLSFSGVVVMWVLWVWGDLETAKIAKNDGIAKSTWTGILRTLEKHGYCQRLAHPNDARRVVVHINKPGEELMEKVFSKYHKIEDVAVSDLTNDEFETTIDSLRTMLHTMEEFTNKDNI